MAKHGAAMFAIVSVAGTSTIITAFEPTATMEAIQNKQVSLALLVPTMVNVGSPQESNLNAPTRF